MSVQYFCNGKEILHTKTSDIDFIHRIIQDHIFEKNISLSPNLENLMAHLEAGGGGVGVDFADYLKTKKDAQEFISLLKMGIKGIENVFVPPYKEKRMQLLWNFYHELVKYAEELELDTNTSGIFM